MNEGKFIFDFTRLDTMAVNDLIPFGKLQDDGTYKVKNIRNTDFLNELIVSSPVTRAELEALVASSGLIAGKFYTITDAVGGTLSLVVQAVNTTVISELAISTTNGEIYTYDYANDTATNGFSTGIIDLTPQTAPSYLRGRVWYDSASETISYYDDILGTSTQIAQENHVRARNSTGSQINDGQVVYVSGATGSNPNITLAQANAASTSRVIGMVTHNIANNAIGKVTTFGIVNDIDTSAFTDGDLLYLSSSVAGGLTTTRPSAPNYAVLVGVCLHAHPTQGRILVNPDQRSLGFGTANQLLGMNAGATEQEYKTLSGTTNQVTVTHGVNGITLSLPQNIHTGATPTFAGLTLTAPLGVASGGTGLSATPTNGQIDIGNGTGFTRTTLTGTNNQVVVTNGAGSITLSLPQSIATTSTPTFANVTLTSALLATSGGTGFNSYAVGDILFASTTTALSRLAGVATGNALISGGVGVAPSWGKIGLTTHVSGTLPIANGGTGNIGTPTNGQLLIGNGTAYTLATLTGTANQVTVTNGAGTITLSLPQSIATTSTPQFSKLGLGTNLLTVTTLRITTPLTGGASVFGIRSDGIVQSDVTSDAKYFQSVVSTQASVFTNARLTHFEAEQATFGVGSTVTTQEGFRVTANLIGATNNYGFRGQIPSGSGRWNTYMDGTANNYFAGNVQIGSATPTAGAEKLQVTGTASVSGALSIGNTVTASAGTPSTHKVTMVIGGVTYYLLATNV